MSFWLFLGLVLFGFSVMPYKPKENDAAGYLFWALLVMPLSAALIASRLS